MSEPTTDDEIDQIVHLLADHQRVSTISDRCTCGTGGDTLYESGAATNRHWRHLALVIRQALTKREHFTCHRKGDRCTWDGCPNQEDWKACDACFLFQPDVTPPPAPQTGGDQ